MSKNFKETITKIGKVVTVVLAGALAFEGGTHASRMLVSDCNYAAGEINYKLHPTKTKKGFLGRTVVVDARTGKKIKSKKSK